MNDFTVVICTYKRHNLIDICLKNIFKNSILPKKIIIVDQNYNYLSFQKIINIFKNQNYKNYLILRNLHQRGLTKSKNISIKHVKTKYVFFIDDDILLEKKYFYKTIKLIFAKKGDGVSGIISNYPKNILKNYFYYLFNFNIFRDNRYFFINYKKLNINQEYRVFQLPGGITCYDMNVFKNISFDEKYIIHNYEDVEFNIRLRKKLINPKLYLCINSLAYDKLSKNLKENFHSRLYYMTLLYLRNKSFKNLIFYVLSLIGFFASNLSVFKITKINNMFSILKLAILKSKN